MNNPPLTFQPVNQAGKSYLQAYPAIDTLLKP